MIVFRYLAREVLLNMLAVSLILLTVIVSGRFVKYLSQAAAGKLDAAVVLSVILYRLPGFLELILPLGLFLGFLLGYGRLYMESEMVVLEACGMSRKRLISYSMGPAIITALIVAVLSVFLSPYGSAQAGKIFEQQAKRNELDSLIAGQFQLHPKSERVSYTDSMSEGKLGLVFIADHNPENYNLRVSLSKTGQIKQQGNQRFLVLEKGRRYEGEPGKMAYSELDFLHYGIEIKQSNPEITSNKVEAIPTKRLWLSERREHMAQLHWRLSLPVLAIIVTLLAVPLSRVNPRIGRFAKLVPSILIYLAYITILSSISSKVSANRMPIVSIWLVHLGFLLLALNLILLGDYWSKIYNRIISSRKVLS